MPPFSVLPIIWSFFLILKVNYIPFIFRAVWQWLKTMTVWTYVWQFPPPPPQPRLIPFFYFNMFAWILGLKTLKKSSTVLSGHAIRRPDFNDGGCHIREQSCCTAYVCWEDWTNFPPLGNIWPCWFLWQCIKITSTVKSVQVSSADKWWHVVITVYRKVVSQLTFGGDCIVYWVTWVGLGSNRNGIDRVHVKW